MDINLFNYNLPVNRIAQAPIRPRERAKMLYYERASGVTRDHRVGDLSSLLLPGDLLVFNVSRVRAARMRGTCNAKRGSQEVELLILKPLDKEGRFECLIKGKKIQIEDTIVLQDSKITLAIIDRIPDPALTRFIIQVGNMTSQMFLDVCEQIGQLPLPPYINNPQLIGHEQDLYQPIFAQELGSVAAPTASLHFSEKLLDELVAKGIKTAKVVLHIGLGTFLPVRVQDTKDHVMHPELYDISSNEINRIRQAKEHGGRVIAVGTTVARALESAASSITQTTQPFDKAHGFGETPQPVELFRDSASLFIQPGYQFKVIDGLLTNFHMPKSTLLMMVSAFIGREKMLELYDHALSNNYRFLSFGDCMLLI